MVEAPVFLDTGYFVALLNRRDVLHARALKLAKAWTTSGRRLLTTDAVLIELGNFFARSPLRSRAIEAVKGILGASGCTVDRTTDHELHRAVARFEVHRDKAWSLTDCLSMESMLKHRATEVATPDHHFTQAGFEILMKS